VRTSERSPGLKDAQTAARSTVLGGGRTTGAWVQGGPPFGPHCTLVKDAGYVDLPSYSPPWLVGVTYRVAFGVKVGAPWKQVRASAFHVPIIT
jgi:hypothetical protein